MDKTGYILLAILWGCGALTTAALHFFWSKAGRDEGKPSGNSLIFVAAVSLVLNLFLWPVFLVVLWEFYRPKLAVLFRIRPGWSLHGKGERESRQWEARDKQSVSANVSYDEEAQQPFIRVDSCHKKIDFRARMIAPRQTDATEWFPMKRPTLEEFEEQAKRFLEEAGEVAEKDFSFRATPQIKKPGKYQIDFRVQLRSGETEELSSVILIVPET